MRFIAWLLVAFTAAALAVSCGGSGNQEAPVPPTPPSLGGGGPETGLRPRSDSRDRRERRRELGVCRLRRLRSCRYRCIDVAERRPRGRRTAGRGDRGILPAFGAIHVRRSGSRG